MFNVTDRATLNNFGPGQMPMRLDLEFLDSDSVNGITVIRLKDNLNNHGLRQTGRGGLSQLGLFFVEGYARIFLIKRGKS